MVLSRGRAAFDFALANPDVKVIMLNRLQPIDLGRLRRAADNDVVVLINSGNNGRDTPAGSATLIPQLGGRGLIVSGHLSDGTIAPSSNRPRRRLRGSHHHRAQQHPSQRHHRHLLRAAAGGRDGGEGQVPRPAPDAVPVVEIIKRTAIDAGAPGVDPVYGVGLLNDRAAFEAVGTIDVADPGDDDDGGSSSSGSGAAAAGALLIGGGLYALLKRNKNLKRTLILDEYGRSFWMDMTTATPKRGDMPAMNLVMADLERERKVVPLESTDEVQSYATIEARSADFRALADADRYDSTGDFTGIEDLSYGFTSVHRSGRRLAFSINDSQREAFGALSLLPDEAQRQKFINTREMSAPFMGFTDRGLSSALSFAPAEGVSVKLGLSSNDDQTRWGLDSESAFFETSYETERFGLALQLGELREKGSLFGGSSGGAFSVDEARTLSLGLSGRFSVTPDTSLIGSYTVGMTDVRHKEPSLVRNFSTLKTDSYGAGVVSVDVFRKGDVVGLGVFQPLRVSRGRSGLVRSPRARYRGQHLLQPRPLQPGAGRGGAQLRAVLRRRCRPRGAPGFAFSLPRRTPARRRR
ncbi:MAG: hypothetical protein M5U09_10795 [Gammaproteobacteria bacterium]|nr:hypothetical protein [Gammaproteobacteria bacterium]